MLDSKPDCFNMLQNIIHIKHLNNKYRNVLETLNTIFTDVSETDRTDLQQIEVKLKTFSQVANVSSCYNQLAIKESLDQCLEENKRLKSEIEHMSIMHVSEISSMENKHSENLKELNATHKQEVATLNSEIKVLNSNFKRREQEFYNEIQVLQAASAMQSDDLETKYMQQLVDINNKLHEAQLVRSNLHLEINSLRSQLKLNDSKKDKKVVELQRKLLCAERELTETRHKLSRVSDEGLVGFHHGEILGNKGVANNLEPTDKNASTNVPSRHAGSNSTVPLYKSYAVNYSAEERSLQNQQKRCTELKYAPLDVSSSVNVDNYVSVNGSLNNSLLYQKAVDYTHLSHGEILDDKNVNNKNHEQTDNNIPSRDSLNSNQHISTNDFNCLEERRLLNQTNNRCPSLDMASNVNFDNNVSRNEGLHTNTLPYKKTPVTIYSKINSKSKSSVKNCDTIKNSECVSDKAKSRSFSSSKKRKLFNPNDLDYLENL